MYRKLFKTMDKVTNVFTTQYGPYSDRIQEILRKNAYMGNIGVLTKINDTLYVIGVNNDRFKKATNALSKLIHDRDLSRQQIHELKITIKSIQHVILSLHRTKSSLMSFIKPVANLSKSLMELYNLKQQSRNISSTISTLENSIKNFNIFGYSYFTGTQLALKPIPVEKELEHLRQSIDEQKAIAVNLLSWKYKNEGKYEMHFTTPSKDDLWGVCGHIQVTLIADNTQCSIPSLLLSDGLSRVTGVNLIG